jgi:hypothetical protein
LIIGGEAQLDVALIGGEFAADALVVAWGFAVQVLVAAAVVEGRHPANAELNLAPAQRA